jgi:hypothetical protein
MKCRAWTKFLRCCLFLSVGFQPAHVGGSSGRDRASSPANMFDSGASLPPRPSCQCTEYSLRISDLEGRLSLMKRQAKLALDKASKSCGFMKQISVLEDVGSDGQNRASRRMRLLSYWYRRVRL